MNRELQTYNGQQKLAKWADIVSQCRSSGLSVRDWCQEHKINISNYYKWQRKIYAVAQAQQKVQFAEITPVQSVRCGNVAVTVRISGTEVDIHTGADAATVEAVLRILKSC